MSRKWDQGFPLGPHLEFLLLPFILSLSLFFAYFEYDFGRRYIRSKEAPDACFFFTFTACFLTRKDHSEEREHTQKKWERKKEIQRWNCAVFRPASFKADREPHTHSYPSVSFLLLCRYFFEYLFYTSLISLWPDESTVRECVWLNGIEGSQWRRRSQDFLPPIFFVVTALLTHSSSFLFLLFRILLRVSVYVKQKVGRRAGRINIQRAVICERIKQRRRSIKVKFPYCHFISICVHRVTGQRHDAIPYWRETLWSFLNICFEIRNWTELRQTIPITYQITGIARLTNLLFLLFLRYFFIQTFQRPTQQKTFLRLRFGCHHNSFALVSDVNRLMITSPAKKKAVNGRVDPKCVAFV